MKFLYNQKKILNHLSKHGVISIPRNYQALWNPKVISNIKNLIKTQKIYQELGYNNDLVLHLNVKSMKVKYKIDNFEILDTGGSYAVYQIRNNKKAAHASIFPVYKTNYALKRLKKELTDYVGVS